MADFKGVVLASDLDGTMITSEFIIPERNREAVARFRSEGGRVVLATGRAPVTTKLFAGQLELSMPCVVYNGAGVYDCSSDRYLWTSEIEKARVADYLGELCERFPSVGVEYWSREGAFQLRPENTPPGRDTVEGVSYRPSSIADLPDRCFKFLTTGDAETTEAVWNFCRETAPEGLVTVCSSPCYCEVLSCSANKFLALKEILLMHNTTLDKTACIGDYYNDIAMIEGGAVGACPSTGVKAAREAADVIVGGVNDGAVADFIEYLENYIWEV